MDYGYIYKLLDKAEEIADKQYQNASYGSSDERGYIYVRNMFRILLDAITEIGEPTKEEK